MNTLRKIQKLESLRDSLGRDAWTVVVGRFDPMTCESADGLEAIAAPTRKLLVVVQSREGELLTVEGRAFLVAALRSVDAVLIEESDLWRHVIGENSNVLVVEDPAAESRREQAFRELVLSRQNKAGA